MKKILFSIFFITLFVLPLYLPNTFAQDSPQQLRTLQGHTDSVYSVSFSPDGTTLASGSVDDTIRLWDVATGRQLRTLQGHTGWVSSVSFSPDGTTLASGSGDDTIRLWDVATGRQLRTLQGHTGWVYSVSFSPDGTTLASGSQDDTIRLWDVATGRQLRTLQGHTSWVYSVSFSPDGTTLASGSQDDTIRLWDVATGRQLRTLQGHTSWVFSVSFSPDGQTLASGDLDNAIRLWDVSSGQQLHTLTGHTNASNDITLSGVYSVSFSPDGQTLASGGRDKTIRLWDVSSGQQLHTLTGHTISVRSVRFSPDGQTLASGSSDDTVLLWEVTPTQPQAQVDLVVEAVQADPDTLAPGEEFKLHATLKNQGDAKSTATTFRYYRSANSILSTSDTELRAFSRDPLAPNETLRRYLTVTAPTEPGTYYYGACVDSIPGESDTNNNCSKAAIVTVVGDADVNKDGVVNLQDVRLIALNLGKTGPNPADVNGDGVVDGADGLLVLGVIGAEAAAAPTFRSELLELFTAEQVQQWLAEGRRLTDKSPAYKRGIQLLEQLLALLTPKETALLPNYPNPFNPETWIPYHLAKPADVTVFIYAADGQLVQMLDVGHQSVGVYESRSRAAYWDGKNTLGEPVASGVYFYTFTAGDFETTRKMLIRK